MTAGQFSELILFLHTDDLDTTSEFYEVILRLQKVLDQGKCRIFKISTGGYLGFCLHIEAANANDSPILTFVTDQVDQIYRRLVDQAVCIEKEPQYNPEFGIYHFTFRDPNGYLIEIQRFLDSNWSKTE